MLFRSVDTLRVRIVTLTYLFYLLILDYSLTYSFIYLLLAARSAFSSIMQLVLLDSLFSSFLLLLYLKKPIARNTKIGKKLPWG